MIVAEYTLTIVGPENESVTDDDKRVLADLPAVMEATEENITDVLPDGYSAKIERES